MMAGQNGECLALVYRHGYVLEICETLEQAETRRKELAHDGKECAIKPASWVRVNPLCLSIRVKEAA